MSDPWGQQQPQQPQQPQGGDWSVPQQQGQSGGFAPPPADSSGQYGAAPAYGYPAAPQQEASNGFAIAGLVLFFTGVLGLIFSIIGLVKSKAAAGKGKGLSIAGLILSIVMTIVWGAVVVGIFSVAQSTALDPGCTSAESQISTLDSQLTSDESNPSALVSDLQTMHQDLVSAENQANHDSVKNALKTFDNDVQNFITDFQAITNGSSTDTTKLTTDASQLTTDGSAVDSICSKL